MSGRVATISEETTAPRVIVLEDDAPHDVFELVGLVDGVIRARSPFLFEIGEELRVRYEQDGKSTEALVRVRAHVGPLDARITELEVLE
jgi:hypothetical protein